MTEFASAMKKRMKAAGVSQAELARQVPMDPGHMSRVATGKVDPPAELADRLDHLLDAGGDLAALAGADQLAFLDGPATAVDERVTASQASWVATRKAFGAHRRGLSELAYDLYPQATRLPDATLLVRPGWIPDQPIPLDQVELTHEVAPAAPIDGTGGLVSHILPRRTLTTRYGRYSHAIRDLSRPRLFANRHCWRLMDAAGPSMTFSDCLYMDGTDVQEAVGHELALASLDADRTGIARRPRMRELPLRHAIGDPTDLTRRPTVAAVSTLTIRRDDARGHSFLLHHRDPGAVLQDGDSMQVVPSGVFQPSSAYPGVRDVDFSLWRNIMRESAEELLGFEEHGGDGAPVDYTAHPLGDLDEAYRDGRVRVFHLGTAVDALTLFGEILTVAVWDADFYDEWCRDLVGDNDEGSIIDQRVPFTGPVIRRILDSGRILSAGAGCLSLAWQHRAALLG